MRMYRTVQYIRGECRANCAAARSPCGASRRSGRRVGGRCHRCRDTSHTLRKLAASAAVMPNSESSRASLPASKH